MLKVSQVRAQLSGPSSSPTLHNEHNDCGRAVTACCVISRSKWWSIPSLARNVQEKITQIRLLL